MQKDRQKIRIDLTEQTPKIAIGKEGDPLYRKAFYPDKEEGAFDHNTTAWD